MLGLHRWVGRHLGKNFFKITLLFVGSLRKAYSDHARRQLDLNIHLQQSAAKDVEIAEQMAQIQGPNLNLYTT